ncbi:hypothetical protein EDB80DRAFT_737898 [Ilyonectria destructans]|nr:hypothetical protein EDB80DRAFT_737898 [Ilyonectria destructans]
MSDNSFLQALVPHSRRHAAALASNELDLGGQLWNGAETALAPTSHPAILDVCQFWYNVGWQQGFSQGASQCYCPYQAMPGAQALPAASPQFPLQMTSPTAQANPTASLANPAASLAGYAAQGAWWPQHGQHLTPPESHVRSPPPSDFSWNSTGGLQAPSSASSDHDHRNAAKCRCGYDELLMEAFRSSPGTPLSIEDIRQWFKTNTHIPTSKVASAWRAGIRRNLTICKVSCVSVLYEKAARLIAI